MAQHDYVIDNSTGANVRADINSALLAISSNNSGSSAPSTTYALQSFANTTDSILQLRNAANNAFVNLRKFDGSLPLPDGSESSPSLFFDDDTNTGIYSSATDTLNITTGGSTAVTVNSSQNVGIGNTAPLSRLHVEDVEGTTLTLGNTAAAASDGDYLSGIDFHIKDNNDGTGATCASIRTFADQNHTASAKGTALALFTTDDDTTTLDERLRITHDGKIGIGTTSPTSTGIQSGIKTVQIDSGDGAELILGNSQSSGVTANHIGAIAFKNIDTSLGTAPHYAGIRCNATDSSGNMNLKFYAGATKFETDSPHMLIDSSGRLALATSTTTSQFQIGATTGGYTWDVGDTPQVLISGLNNESPSSGTLNIALRVQDENSNTLFQVHNRGGGNSDVGQVFVNGKLGIGTDNPSEKLNVSGNILATGTITPNSDIAFKKDIEPLTNVLNKVTQLIGINFTYKNNNEKSMGLVAQDVEKVFPELVRGEEGNKSLNYMGLTGALIEAIKELSARIEALEAA